MDLPTYSFVIFFFFFLVNHARICILPRNFVFSKVHEKVRYAIQCPFCFTFWISIPVNILWNIPIEYIFAAPVLVLFLDLFCENLGGTQN